MTPSTEIVFLGFLIDSVQMQVYPTKEKREKIIRAGNQLLSSVKPSIREVAGFVGLAGSYCTASDYGANYTKFLELAKNKALSRNKGDYDGRMVLSEEAKKDVHWWLQNVFNLSKDFAHVKWDFTITTDASKSGWGAVSPKGNTNGRWSSQETLLHINVLNSKQCFLA